MAARAEALTAFHSGPVWPAHREAADATMVDPGDALVLRPLGDASGLASGVASGGGVVVAHVHHLGRTEPAPFAEVLARRLRPRLAEVGSEPFAAFATEASLDVPRLPVGEGEAVFVWLARHADEAARERARARLAGLRGRRDGLPGAVLPALMRRPERLRLAAAARFAPR